MDRFLDRILNGSFDGSNFNSENRVNDLPGGFKKWVYENADRAKNAKALPYFYTDNPKYFLNPKYFYKVPS
jgi:hypothetical protein